MKNPQEAQQKYMELQMLAQNIKQARMQVEALEEQSMILEKTKATVSALSESKEKEILFPVGQGVFFKGKLTVTDSVIMNVGANIAVAKSVEESVKIIDSQLNEMKSFQQELIANVTDNSIKAKKLEQEVQALLK